MAVSGRNGFFTALPGPKRAVSSPQLHHRLPMAFFVGLPSVDGRIRPRNSFKSDPDLLSPVIDTCCVFGEIVTDWMAV